MTKTTEEFSMFKKILECAKEINLSNNYNFLHIIFFK
jgi:hypothetical protein